MSVKQITDYITQIVREKNGFICENDLEKFCEKCYPNIILTDGYGSRGKYFDTFKFNAEFDKYIEEQEKKRLLNNELKTHDLNTIENERVDIYNTPIKQILINIQTFWFNIFDNIINGENLFKNCDYGDFFYAGITFIAVVLIYIILSFIFY